MPSKRGVIKCTQCKGTSSLMWHPIGDNQQICHDCYEKNRDNLKDELEPSTTTKPLPSVKIEEKKTATRLRKSTRSTRYKSKSTTTSTIQNAGSSGSVVATSASVNGTGQTKSNGQKSGGRGRRNICRRAPIKAPSISATTTHVKSLFHKVIYRIT